MKRSSEDRKDEDTTTKNEFLMKLAEERKDEDTKMQSIFLTNPVEERKDKGTTEKINFLKKSTYVQTEDREYQDTMIKRFFL